MHMSFMAKSINIILLITALLFVSLLATQSSFAVGGISNSKVIVPSVDTVPKKHLEIEPAVVFSIIDDEDDTYGSEFGVRFTYGVFSNLEAGINIGFLTTEDSDALDDVKTDFGDFAVGIKYRFLDQSSDSPFSLAFQSGITFPTSDDDAPWNFEFAGLIFTRNFTDKLSMDTDIVVGYLGGNDNPDTFTINGNTAFGYFLNNWLQPVVEIAYSYENPEDDDAEFVLTLTGGFTAKISDRYLLIVGVSPDLVTKNTDNKIVFLVALTMLF